MSTLRIDNLSNSAGTQSTSVLNAINGSAKAWVNFNGTGVVAIRQAFNVSSITDNGVGDYTVNFTTPMIDANYGVNISRGNNPSNGLMCVNDLAGLPSANSIRLALANAGNTATQDTPYVYLTVFR